MKYFIYKIVHKYNKNDFYVGSTKDLKDRIIQHKQSCKKPKYKLHLFITENGGFNNFYFYIIDIIECEEGQQFITEDKYITDLNPRLNTNKAYVENKVEYNKEQNKKHYEKNKETRNEQIKQYYENNKETRKEYSKKYYENNKETRKEQIKRYNEANTEKLKEYHKQYKQANKEKIKEQKKQYKQANKEKIKEQKKLYYQRKKQQLI